MDIFFGEVLRELRQNANMTQAALADSLGISFQTVSKWENGNTYPDITMLVQIAAIFGVTIDTLLGIKRTENEQKINEYLQIYNTLHFKNTNKLLNEFENAVREFPNDYRILVRYMELLSEEKDVVYIKAPSHTAQTTDKSTNNPYKLGFIKNPDYEVISHKLLSIYDNIQNHCTDDHIRIWSKHIIINHLILRYDLSYDEKKERWRCDSEALKKAQDILETMPALCDARECIEGMVNHDNSKRDDILINTIEELVYLLQNEISCYCYYDNRFSQEYKIETIKHMNALIKIIDNDDYVSKNRLHLIYNYGHLGYLYCELGDYDNTIKYLKICAKLAKELDNNPEVAEKILRFYEREHAFRDMSVSNRMSTLMKEHYPLDEKIKSSAKFREIIDFLDNE